MKLRDYTLSPLIWVIIAGVFLSRIGISMSIPFLAIFLHFKAGLSLETSGLLIGASYLTFTLGGFWGGILSDKFGRYLLLEVSLACYAIIFILFGLTAHYVDSKIVMTVLFLLLNLLAGLFRIWVNTLTQALLSDLATKEQKFATFSIRFAAGNLGFAIGPAIGVAMGFSGDLKGFYMTAAMCIAYLLVFMIFTRKIYKDIPKKPVERSVDLRSAVKILLNDKALIFYIISAMIVFCVTVQHETTLGQIIVDRLGSSHLFSILLSLNAIVTVCFQIVMTHYLLTKMNYLQLMKLGCVLLAISMFGMAVAGSHVYLYIISEVVFTFGEMFVFSVTAIFIDEIAPTNLRGAYFGVLGLQYFGKAVGPFLGGVLLGVIHSTFALSFFGIVVLAPIFIFEKSNKAYKERCSLNETEEGTPIEQEP